MEEGDEEQNPLLKEQNEDHTSIGVETTTSMSPKSSGMRQSPPQLQSQQKKEEEEDEEEQQEQEETFSADQQMWLREEVSRILEQQEGLRNRRSSIRICTHNLHMLDCNEIPTQEGDVEEDIDVIPSQEPATPRPDIYRESGSIFFNSFRTNIRSFRNVWKDIETLRKCMLSVQFSIVIYILFRQNIEDGFDDAIFSASEFDMATGVLVMFSKIFEGLWNLHKTPRNSLYYSMLMVSLLSVAFVCMLLVGIVDLACFGLAGVKGLEAIYIMLCYRCQSINSGERSDNRYQRDTSFQAFLQCIGTGILVPLSGVRVFGALSLCLATISQIDSLDQSSSSTSSSQNQLEKGSHFRNIWNTIFKIFTSLSFMIATNDKAFPPFALLIACQFFDGHKIMLVVKHMSPVHRIFLFLPTSRKKEAGEGEKTMYQFIVRLFVAVCYFILPVLVMHPAGSVLWISLIVLWSLIRCCIVLKEEKKISSFHTASYIYLFFTLVALLVQTVLLYNDDGNFIEKIPFLGNVIGGFYLIHTFCWIQVKFSNESEVIQGDNGRERRLRLTEDTYTFMLFADSFTQLYGWLGFIVFLLQATLMWMILATQWDQYKKSDHFLDVPFDVSYSTHIGQFAGLIILIFYQNDYWVASSLFEISLTTIGAIQIVTKDNLISSRKMTKISKWSTNVTSLLRLLLSVLVILSSTILLIQSNNIIDLVKDYTAIFFVSEIDEVVFKLTLKGYLGMKLQEKAKEVKGVEVKDLAQYIYRSVAFMIIFTAMLSLWIVVVTNQMNGTYFLETGRGNDCSLVMNEYGYDWRENLLKFNDGSCDIEFNYIECDFDGGDCTDENFLKELKVSSNSSYQNCKAPYKLYIGNGRCDFGKYNTLECGWDGGDCEVYNNRINCTVDNPSWIGDKECDWIYNNKGCGFDGGDCLLLKNKYPKCSIENLNDANCPVGKDFPIFFPKCKVKVPSSIGGGYCNGGDYNTLECGWDGGACLIEDYPSCHVDFPSNIGNGYCDGGAYNTLECGWDGGDCAVKDYPNCHVDFPSNIGNGYCDGGAYNTLECGWDGRDCL